MVTGADLFFSGDWTVKSLYSRIGPGSRGIGTAAAETVCDVADRSVCTDRALRDFSASLRRVNLSFCKTEGLQCLGLALVGSGNLTSSGWGICPQMLPNSSDDESEERWLLDRNIAGSPEFVFGRFG
jgi:hypothetical protein